VPRSSRAFTLALCNEVVRDLPFREQCDLAARLGYDALEVAPFTLTDDPRAVTDSQLAAWRRQAEDAGVRVSSLHWLLMTPEGLSITSRDVFVRARTFEVIAALVRMCAHLGGEVLVHGSPRQRELAAEDPEGDAQRGREAFAFAAERAADAGVVYCIEPLSPRETAFVNTVAEAEAIVRAVGSPALRTMVDTRAARLAEAERVEDVLARGLAAGTVAHVHVNDTSDLAPGQGEDQFLGVFEVLERAGYAGTVAVEPFVYVPDGPTAAARAAGYVTGILEALRVGREGTAPGAARDREAPGPGRDG